MKKIIPAFILVLGLKVGAQTAQNPGSMTNGSMTNGSITNETLPLGRQTFPGGGQTMGTMGNSQSAPTSESTMGPAGRPNTELVPSTTGTVNSIPNSTLQGDATILNRSRLNTRQGVPIPPPTTLPPNTTSPIPTTN